MLSDAAQRDAGAVSVNSRPDWLTSEKGLAVIRGFRVRGEQLFFAF